MEPDQIAPLFDAGVGIGDLKRKILVNLLLLTMNQNLQTVN